MDPVNQAPPSAAFDYLRLPVTVEVCYCGWPLLNQVQWGCPFGVGSTVIVHDASAVDYLRLPIVVQVGQHHVRAIGVQQITIFQTLLGCPIVIKSKEKIPQESAKEDFRNAVAVDVSNRRSLPRRRTIRNILQTGHGQLRQMSAVGFSRENCNCLH